MKKKICRLTAVMLAMLMLCLCAVPPAAAENSNEPAATSEPTEKPKVSAAELQNQGILTVGAKGGDVKRLQ